MGAAETFRDLFVWQKAHQYVLAVYAYTGKLPKEEKFGLASQFRRAAVSIAANIAEGFKKSSKREKARYMNIAQSSVEECRYYEILCKDLNYGGVMDLTKILEETSRMLEAYYKSIIASI